MTKLIHISYLYRLTIKRSDGNNAFVYIFQHPIISYHQMSNTVMIIKLRKVKCRERVSLTLRRCMDLVGHLRRLYCFQSSLKPI